MHVRVFPRLALIICAGISLVVLSTVNAQPNNVALKKAYNEVDTRRRELNSGTAEAKKADAKVAEAVASWHILRLTVRFEKLDKAQEDFAREIADLMDKKNLATKRAYIDLLGPACVNAMKEVLANDIKTDGTVVLYAAQMLPTMAKLKQDYVCDYLISLIDDPKTHDAIRLHALKAMKDMMPIRVQQEMFPAGNDDYKDKAQNVKRAHDVKNVGLLVKFIEKSPQNLPADQVATHRFLRREAIIALAAAGSPAVTAHPKAPRPLDGPVAPTLMKVLIKGGVQPPANLPEKVEAALGLCAMEYPFMPDYNSEISVYLVGKTVEQFIGDYDKDVGNFARFGKDRQLPFHAWKTDSKRLQAGITQLITNAKDKNSATEKAAKELQLKTKALLDRVYAYDQTDAGRLRDLETALPKLLPKSSQVFKTAKSATIPLD